MDNCFGPVLVVSGVLSHVLMKGVKPSLTCYSVYRRSWFTQIAVYSRSSPDGWFTTSLCLRRRSLWDRLVAHISYFIWHAILGLKSRPRVSDDKKKECMRVKLPLWKNKITRKCGEALVEQWNTHNITICSLSCTKEIQKAVGASFFFFFFFFQLGKLN